MSALIIVKQLLLTSQDKIKSVLKNFKVYSTRSNFRGWHLQKKSIITLVLSNMFEVLVRDFKNYSHEQSWIGFP